MRLICRVECHRHIAVVKHRETGEVYRAKRIGPRTDPCGTPDVIVDGEEQASSILTDCVLLVR